MQNMLVSNPARKCRSGKVAASRTCLMQLHQWALQQAVCAGSEPHQVPVHQARFTIVVYITRALLHLEQAQTTAQENFMC